MLVCVSKDILLLFRSMESLVRCVPSRFSITHIRNNSYQLKHASRLCHPLKLAFIERKSTKIVMLHMLHIEITLRGWCAW